MSRLVKSLIGWGLLLIACLFFQYMNPHAVPIYLYSHKQTDTVYPVGQFAEFPLCWVVFISLALGAVLALMYTLGPLKRAEAAAADARQAAARLKKRLQARIGELEEELAAAGQAEEKQPADEAAAKPAEEEASTKEPAEQKPSEPSEAKAERAESKEPVAAKSPATEKTPPEDEEGV